MRFSLISAVVVAASASFLIAADPAVQETTYRGKVVDANGQPLAGAKVNCYAALVSALKRFEFKEVGAVTTAADGKFSFTPNSPSAMAVIVTARKEGLSCDWSDWEGPDSSDVVLALGKPAVMSGVVLDEANKPVAGATLHPLLQLEGETGRPRHMIGIEPASWLIVKTDAAGKFQFSGLPEGAKAEFIVDAPGKARLSTIPEGGPTLEHAAGQTDIKFVMKAEGRIEGVLAQKDGKPIAGAAITAAGHGDFADEIMDHSATTDKDGKFALGGLDAGEYKLEMGGAKGVPDFIAVAEAVKVEFGKTTSGVKMEAIAGGLLQVTVVDDKGKPIPGARVSPMRQTSPNSYSGTAGGMADDKGVATFRMEPGVYEAYASATGFGSNHGPTETVTLEEGKTAQLKLELPPLAKLVGMVRDANGKPVEGAMVRFGDPQGWLRASSSPKTDANGRFEAPYQYYGQESDTIGATVVVRQVERGLVGKADVEDVKKPIEITVKPGAALKGLVVGEDGKPIAKATVEAHYEQFASNGGPDNQTAAVTDDKGQYQIKGMPTGEIRVIAAAAGFGLGSASAEVAEGKNEVEVEKIALKVAKLSITGAVTDANSQPVAGAMIYVNGEGQNHKGMVKTDKSGKFTIDKLVEGDVDINVMAGRGLYGQAQAKAGDKDVDIVVQEPSMGPTRRGGGKVTSQPKGEDF